MCLTKGASLIGFTLTNGATFTYGAGGGVLCEYGDPPAVLSNCVLAGNSASIGGGAANGTLNNCVLSANSARSPVCPCFDLPTGLGGGAAGAVLNNCILTGNSASYGAGGVSDCTLNNCIVYFNTTALGVEANYSVSTLNHSCTTPLPTNGQGNITNLPLFVDPAAGNFRLQSNSPCINAGRNSLALSAADLDGYPRIVGGSVDIGAYEFQTPQSTLSYAWLQQYGLATDGSADFADPDGDGHNNWQEWRARTDPTNSVSALRLLVPTTSANGQLVRWQSVIGQTYFLERSTNLLTTATFVRCASNIFGQAGTTSFADTNALGSGPFFYRVGVKE